MILDRNKIDLAMARKSYSITKLAELYGVSAQRMRVILNSRNVSPVTAGRIASVLGVDITEIIE